MDRSGRVFEAAVSHDELLAAFESFHGIVRLRESEKGVHMGIPSVCREREVLSV